MNKNQIPGALLIMCEYGCYEHVAETASMDTSTALRCMETKWREYFEERNYSVESCFSLRLW
jgi:hypothetical protein